MSWTTSVHQRNRNYSLYLSSNTSTLRYGTTCNQLTPSQESQAVGYFSKEFSQLKSRLSSHYLEIQAAYAIKHFEYHLIGVSFISFINRTTMLFQFKNQYGSQLTTKLHNCLIFLNHDINLILLNGDDSKMAFAKGAFHWSHADKHLWTVASSIG